MLELRDNRDFDQRELNVLLEVLSRHEESRLKLIKYGNRYDEEFERYIKYSVTTDPVTGEQTLPQVVPDPVSGEPKLQPRPLAAHCTLTKGVREHMKSQNDGSWVVGDLMGEYPKEHFEISRWDGSRGGKQVEAMVTSDMDAMINEWKACSITTPSSGPQKYAMLGFLKRWFKDLRRKL